MTTDDSCECCTSFELPFAFIHSFKATLIPRLWVAPSAGPRSLRCPSYHLNQGTHSDMRLLIYFLHHALSIVQTHPLLNDLFCTLLLFFLCCILSLCVIHPSMYYPT